MANKYYAVKKGLTPGVYDSWEECKAQVEGFSGATYKSFKTMDEAMAYLGDVEAAKQPDDYLSLPKDEAVAYVDGSFNAETGEFAYGAVIFHNGRQINLSAKSGDDSLASMRNVAGEIKGSEAAIRYAADNDIKKITIFHDYEGIAKWPTGEWKTNKEGTASYKAFYDAHKGILDIRFVKVKGHSGDKYNDLADSLAKKALGIE
ncbi:MAG: reverse transcriptase-like protein [Lachnospiraceae bacterium]|nr:reverse transcriptase-like protein [Lachnospiraceae bacterium]